MAASTITVADNTVIKSLSLGGTQGGGVPCAVDVKDGKVVRVRPLHYDWKYNLDDYHPWKISRNGKTLTTITKSLPGPFQLAYKKRVYSPNRIKYPLKRVDWDPNGERNPQNRGKSKYKRISWDEATDIIAAEIARVHKQYGGYAILAQVDGHSECKQIHAPHACPTLLLDKLGGYTVQVRNPDSWEGWYWGAKHVWGDGVVGCMFPADNVLKDISENCEQVLLWGCDPETTTWGFCGQSGSPICYFWKEAGIKQVYICPELNYGAAVHADKWIPILPCTDAALQLAIIYTWIKEGTYNKEYIATHAVGFDKISDYVTGKTDGVPKSPAWASPRCGVPEWTIKALAREFASKVTSITHYYGGGMIRGPYSHEPARLEVVLLGMRGLGGPGIHQFTITRYGIPRNRAPRATLFNLQETQAEPLKDRVTPTLPELAFATVCAITKQFLPKTYIQKAILNPPVSFWGTGSIKASVEDQFNKYTFPIPKEEGGSEIHMIWTDTPCRTTCWNEGNKNVEAMRSPKIECIIAQHAWLENDCLLADIILPGNTTFEVEDLVPNTSRTGIEFQSVGLQRRAVAPVGESMSDFEIVLEISKKMGMYEQVSEGKNLDEWLKYFYDYYHLSEFISWEDLKEKQYAVFPIAEDWEKDTPGLRKFYEDPEKNPLPTPSGKLEFYSERLAQTFPDDMERPPYPQWIEGAPGWTHDENLSSKRAEKYPLLMMSNHGRWRMHAQCDDIAWTRETPTGKIKGPDGYMYEPLWLNPRTAAERGIGSGDIVKAFNERGAVLCGAIVWERIMPGVAYVDHGARVDWIIPGELDRGGAVNLICPMGVTSRNISGQTTNGYLVEVERVSAAQMEEWKKKYPEAFNREYDPASGLRFNGWVIKEEE
ncbi:MAG: molybdopterin-dependent oxidoreductase [Dehalococcoidales bacterium]|nr:molybdopterin-dependent oxidoreductase [Dehalococcoidales bacterium]